MRKLVLVQNPNHTLREHTSGSSVDKYNRCPRAWGFEKLAGIKVLTYLDDGSLGELPWLTKGHGVESHIESYLKGGNIALETEDGQRALACLHLLPKPHETDWMAHQQLVNIDTRIILPNVQQIEVQGAKDLVFRQSANWVDTHSYPLGFNLVDYKTTRGDTRKKDPWAYVKTQEQLLADTPANIYALDMMVNLRISEVPARWVYTLTDIKRPPDARCTDVVFKEKEVLARTREIFNTADEMRAIVRTFARYRFNVNQLTPKFGEACKSFGGCAYRKEIGGPCTDSRTLGDMIRMTQPQMTPLEQAIEEQRRINQQAGQQGGAPPGYPPQGFGPPPGGFPVQPQGQFQPPPGQPQYSAAPPGGFVPPQQPPMGAPPGFPPQQQPQQQQPGFPGVPGGYGAPQSGAPLVQQPPQGFAPQQQPYAPQQGYGPAQQGGYMPPQAPHLPPEAQQQPMGMPPQMGPGQGPPALPPPQGNPALQGAPPGPLQGGPAVTPAKRPRRTRAQIDADKAAALAAGQTLPPAEADDESEDRALFMQAFVVSACMGAALQDPARTTQITSLAINQAHMAWQALQHAGA